MSHYYQESQKKNPVPDSRTSVLFMPYHGMSKKNESTGIKQKKEKQASRQIQKVEYCGKAGVVS